MFLEKPIHQYTVSGGGNMGWKKDLVLDVPSEEEDY